MLRKLDQVFGWAGVRRLSDLQHLSCSDSKNYAVCDAKVSLRVDGTARSYNVEFDGNRGKLEFAAFYPDEPTPSDVKARGFYTPDQNTVKDPKLRAFAIAAVAKFNRHLRWHWFSGPSIHREGRDLASAWLSDPLLNVFCATYPYTLHEPPCPSERRPPCDSDSTAPQRR